MTQKDSTGERQQAPQDEVLTYPFPLADHSLEMADPTVYERLQAACPVARVRMPVGGEAFLLTRHANVIQALTDPRCGIVQVSDGDVPRWGRGRTPGQATEMASLFSVPDARHNQVRRLVTQAFTVKAASALAPLVYAAHTTACDSPGGTICRGALAAR
jgi:cytochrome P450